MPRGDTIPRYRQFALVNGNGATWELTDPSFKVFAATPVGLGFDTDTSYIRVGNDNIVTYSQFAMVEKSFDIIFYDDLIQDKYKKYFEFVNFLMIEPIYLLYSPPYIDANTYRMKVKVTSLAKTQVDVDTSALICPISMTPLSFWEDNIPWVYYVSATTDDEGKTYPLERPYSYAPLGTSNIPLVCGGSLPSPLQITVDGASTDVAWSLFDSNGEEYGAAKFIGTYDSVYVNSDESDESIKLMNGTTEVGNPYNYQDLSVGSPDKTQVTFLRLKPMTTSVLSFNLPSTFTGEVKVEYRNRYLSV